MAASSSSASNGFPSGHLSRGVIGNRIARVDCPCGQGSCDFLMSKTANNPNRWFYRCPMKGSTRCNYFCWVDEYPRHLMENEEQECNCGAAMEVRMLKRELALALKENDLLRERIEFNTMVSDFNNMRMNH